MPFTALGLDARILQAVKEAGYTEPTPIQSAAIPEILTGQDLIGIAQTGTGKTAAFTLPLLTKLAGLQGQGPLRGIKALILAPTRELVAQIEENVKGYARHRTCGWRRSSAGWANDRRSRRCARGWTS